MKGVGKINRKRTYQIRQKKKISRMWAGKSKGRRKNRGQDKK